MKTTINQSIKNVLFAFSLIACFGISTSAKIVSDEKPGFSGKWILNLSKSNFGDNPLYVVPKQINVLTDKSYFDITFLATGNAGADSTFHEKDLLEETPFQKQSADQRTVKYVVSLTDDGMLLNRDYSASFSGKPDEEEFHATEAWKLSEDGKSLTLDKQVKAASGYEYAVKAVYDKQ